MEAAGRGSIGKGKYPLLALALALAVTAALLSLLAYPALARSEQGDEDPLLWSADLSIAELEGLSIGGITAADFSNQGGSAGLQAKRLYYSYIDGDLRLSLTDVIPRDGILTLSGWGSGD